MGLPLMGGSNRGVDGRKPGAVACINPVLGIKNDYEK